MSIRLLEELQKKDEYDTAVFLTYKINLRFFELMILPRLRRMGVSRIGILIDQRGYQESLSYPVTQELCGKEYVLVPIHLARGGIQHAKLLWLQKQKTITAYLGSHNLTIAGYNDQAEVTARLTSADPGHIQALRHLHEVLSSIMPSALEYVWHHTKNLPDTDKPPTITALTSLNRSLFGQIIEYIQTADELRVITPFLNAVTLKRLREAVQAQTIVLDLPKEGADTSLLQAVETIPGLQPRALKDRRLHAKVYQFTTSQTSWLAIGSANCTQAALMKSVAEGGNLEFLLLVKDTVLSDDLTFTAISDPANFPYTGRNWDADLLSDTPIMIEEASYKDGRLAVRWRLLEEGAVSDLSLFADGNHIVFYSEPSFDISAFLNIPPQIITLKITFNGSVFETNAWVMNYDALDKTVTQTKIHKWAERIASDDPQQHAESIALWFDEGIQELIQSHHEADSAPSFATVPTEKHGKAQQMNSFYEIFAYSPDPKAVLAGAKLLLEHYGNTDRLVLLRVLLLRFAAEQSSEAVVDPSKDDDSYYSATQHSLVKRKIAAQNIIKHLSRQIDRLVKAEVTWNNIAEQSLIVGLKTLLVGIAHTSDNLDEIMTLKDKEDLASHYIQLLDWVTSLPSIEHLKQKLEIQAPLLLIIGVAARSAECSKDQALYRKLQKNARKLIKEDLRHLITMWKQRDPVDLNQLLTPLMPPHSKQGNIWHRIEPHLLKVFEIIPEQVARAINQRWGVLLALQEADMHASPRSEDLYTQAQRKYADKEAEVWAHYVQARRAKRLPVVSPFAGQKCPRCHLLLPEQKQRCLRRGEAIICDNCRQILLLR